MVSLLRSVGGITLKFAEMKAGSGRMLMLKLQPHSRRQKSTGHGPIFQNHQDASLGLFVRHGKKRKYHQRRRRKGHTPGAVCLLPSFRLRAIFSLPYENSSYRLPGAADTGYVGRANAVSCDASLAHAKHSPQWPSP